MNIWYVTIVRGFKGAALPEQTRYEFADEFEAKARARFQIKQGFGIVSGRTDGSLAIETAPDLIKWIALAGDELRVASK